MFDNTLRLNGFLTFSNYLALKKLIDKKLKNSDLFILDFSDVEFIDHTVVHHLEDYEQNLELLGKKLSIVHDKKLVSISAHPLAPKYISK